MAQQDPAPNHAGAWYDVAAVTDITPGVPFYVVVEGVPVAVYRVGGEYFATEDTCSHMEASLSEGEQNGYIITCPRHGGQFDIRTGAAVRMPAVTPIATFPVEVVGTRVRVYLSRP